MEDQPLDRRAIADAGPKVNARMDGTSPVTGAFQRTIFLVHPVVGIRWIEIEQAPVRQRQ